ncbi:MAG TPA: hypothetical protein VLA15_07800 [Desulfurivibrionaceae bacterium]|nr:hypothetical protein [Desulfurivibrionaceae bacterium]
MATRPLLALLGALLLISGCSGLGTTIAQGNLYTKVIRPYSTDFRNSPVGSKRCVLDEHQLREPVSGYGVSVEWSTDRILAGAQAAGISRISYTEMESMSFLLGIYRRQRLIIYGD